jgi:hypothetical protein
MIIDLHERSGKAGRQVRPRLTFGDTSMYDPTPTAEHVPLPYEGAELSGENASVEAVVPSLVRAVGILGVCVGATRLFYGGTDGWWNMSVMATEGATVREAVALLVGLINALLGAGLVAACAACLHGKGWGQTLFMLNEQMAIVLYLLGTMAALATLNVRTYPGEMAGQSWYVAGDLIGYLVVSIAYPTLGLAILRQRVVRAWFRRSEQMTAVTQTEPVMDSPSASAGEPPSRKPDSP